jgi:hypothetical protein
MMQRSPRAAFVREYTLQLMDDNYMPPDDN